jgi:ribosomal protein S18 acetylase RimI-like enzyme
MELTDGAGVVGRYGEYEHRGERYLDPFDRESGVDAARAARALLDQRAGTRIAADEDVGRALIAGGGRLLRHAHQMAHDLVERPSWSAPPGYRLTDVDRPAADLVDAYRAAYAPDHVDHRDEPAEKSLADLESYVSGGEFGPLLRGSGLAVAADGTVAGAILLGTLPEDDSLSGPWVIEVFRHPAHRGVGRPLVGRALELIEASELGLMVSEGNPARGLYESLGFRLVESRLVVALDG